MWRNRRIWVLCGALVLGAIACLAFLRPVLVAPVAGDDRHVFVQMAAYPSWTPLTDLHALPTLWDQRVRAGRVSILTLLERRTAARMVMDTALRTGLSTAAVLGLLKLVLILASVLSMTAFVKSLRWRREDGVLVRAARQTVVLATVAGGVLFTLGSQPQFLLTNGRNAWVNYPTNSYGAVISVFGVVALVIWLTRLYAQGRARVAILIGLVVLGVVTNFRYELTFVAVPLSLVALALVPATPSAQAAEGRRAKWVTGAAYAGVFLVTFAATRLYLGIRCADGGCSPDVTVRLSADMVRTFWFNVVSSLPGAGSGKTIEYVAWAGVPTKGMYTPTAASVIVAGGMAAAMLLCWWWSRSAGRTLPARPAAPSAPPSDEPLTAVTEVSGGPGEAPLLAIGAALCLLGALGSAAVMSLSVSPQLQITEVGLLYRHTVISWAGMAWAVVLAVAALSRWRPRAEIPAWLSLALVTAVLGAVLMPANERSLTADRKVNSATVAAFAALARGDLSDAANAYRCGLVPRIRAERHVPGGGERTAEGFQQAFQTYWGQPFCQR